MVLSHYGSMVPGTKPDIRQAVEMCDLYHRPQAIGTSHFGFPHGAEQQSKGERRAREGRRRNETNPSPFHPACFSRFFFLQNGPCITMACLPCMTIYDSRTKDEEGEKEKKRKREKEKKQRRQGSRVRLFCFFSLSTLPCPVCE